MAITNHPQLVDAIQDWMMDRSDLAEFAPDCITLAEAYLNYGGDWDKHDRPLRCRQMETITTLTPDASGVYPLPPDYLQYKAITENSVNPRRSLAFIEPVGANKWYPSGTGGGGINFTIIGNNIHGYPNSGATVELIYYARIPALTELAPVNWLITSNPAIYLYGALMMAADKIKFVDEQQKYSILLRSFVSAMNDSDAMSRFNRAGLSMLGPCP
jgi:hypothetical protein